MAPIHFHGLDLDNILQSFPTMITSFPMKYIGLPLSAYSLRHVHFQRLDEKVTSKLKPSHENQFNVGERRILV